MRVAMRGVGRASSLLVFVVIVALIGCGRGTPAREPVTFSTDVAPILYGRCVTCHRPGQVGPFALLSYEDARSRAADRGDDRRATNAALVARPE